MRLERLQLLRQRLAGVVPVLEDRLQSLRRHRFHAHQRALDIGLLHRVKILAVFAGLHRDLRKEHHVLGQLGQLFHQLKALFANRRQLFQFGRVVLLSRQPQIGQRHRIEVVVGQRNEPEPKPPQRRRSRRSHFETAAAAASAHRSATRCKTSSASGIREWSAPRPTYIFPAFIRSQRAARNSLAFDPSALVDLLRLACQAIGHHLAPGHIAVALHHRMCLRRAPALPRETAWRECRHTPPTRRGCAPSGPPRSRAAHCPCAR